MVQLLEVHLCIFACSCNILPQHRGALRGPNWTWNSGPRTKLDWDPIFNIPLRASEDIFQNFPKKSAV